MPYSIKPTRAGAVAILAASAVVLGGCADNTDSGAGTTATAGASATLLSAGKLKMCTHLSYKPFEFKDSSGKVVGFDVDIVNLVAKKMNATVEVVDIPFEQITSGAAFAAKKCDLGIAGTTIKESRQQAAPFSDPYFTATQALLTKKGSGIKDLASLKGKKLGVQTDTTGQEYGEKNKAANGYTTVVFEDMPSQFAAVLAGKVDAAINDNGVALDYAKTNTSTEMVTEFNTGEKYGIQFKKGDANADALRKLTNETLAAAKKDGSYATIYKKWFQAEPPAESAS